MLAQIEFKNLVFSCTLDELKKGLGRNRLKFTKEEITFYLEQFYLFATKDQSYINLFNEYEKKKNQEIETNQVAEVISYKNPSEVTYRGFIKNVKTVSKLYGKLFNKLSKDNPLTKEEMEIVAVDTSLIASKQEHCITSKDFETKNVTVRAKKGINNKKN